MELVKSIQEHLRSALFKPVTLHVDSKVGKTTNSRSGNQNKLWNRFIDHFKKINPSVGWGRTLWSKISPTLGWGKKNADKSARRYRKSKPKPKKKCSSRGKKKKQYVR
jgi:hypothetical protein